MMKYPFKVQKNSCTNVTFAHYSLDGFEQKKISKSKGNWALMAI